ncbi:MAG: hypothetical protein Q4C53_07935 [Clostridia bacterium]|nr:hypothetical protein [Clostridia bacterium]
MIFGKRKIKYSRRPLCMGDDAMNSVYTIALPRNATLGELLRALATRGHGNDWPIPSGDHWRIRSNRGDLANLNTRTGETEYLMADADTPIASLGLKWVYADFETDLTDALGLPGLFRDP